MTPLPISIDGDKLRIHFNRFDLEAYALFLKAKKLPEFELAFDDSDETYRVSAPSRFAPMLGVAIPPREVTTLPLPSFLLDDQVAIIRMALEAKRFGVWSDCGLGKTLIMLEVARQVAHLTGGRGLILTMNEIVGSFLEECRKFYGDSLKIRRLDSRAEMRRWCAGEIEGSERIAITNYEKMNPDDEGQVVNELRMLTFLGLDESSRLKTGGGKQKWAIIHSSRGIPYKLSATATPAPNDTMEFASQASFLEKMRSEGEIIWTYFTRDPQTQEWIVKPHAREAFFEFMSSWSIYVRNPKRYGWRLGIPDVPEPVVIEHAIGVTEQQREFITTFSKEEQRSMFAEKSPGMVARGKMSQAAKGFVYINNKAESRGIRHIESLKPDYVAGLIASERMAGHSVLVWTVFDEEAHILSQALGRLPTPMRPPADEVGMLFGETPDARREAILSEFRSGARPILISRASMLGYGQNLQNCSSMIFNGWNDSFEQWYQAVRRAYRFGQNKSLRVHVPVVPELEGQQLSNIQRKQQQFERYIAEMEANYIKAFGVKHEL